MQMSFPAKIKQKHLSGLYIFSLLPLVCCTAACQALLHSATCWLENSSLAKPLLQFSFNLQKI